MARRRSIEALVPTAGKADADGLREVDADALAVHVIDVDNPWWRRRPCALAGLTRAKAIYAKLTAP